MLPLVATPHGTVELDRPRRFVRMARSNTPFVTLEQVRDFYESVAVAVEKLERRALTLVVDLRQAPARNDPAFEAMVAAYRKRMFTGFSRVGVLVKTAAGKLNVSRHAKGDGHDVTIFHDEATALAWLEMPGDSPSSRGRPPRPR